MYNIDKTMYYRKRHIFKATVGDTDGSTRNSLNETRAFGRSVHGTVHVPRIRNVP